MRMNECNGKMEFFYQYREGDGTVALTLPADASLAEAIEGFETFLRAAGYVFDGNLEINGNFIDPSAEVN